MRRSAHTQATPLTRSATSIGRFRANFFRPIVLPAQLPRPLKGSRTGLVRSHVAARALDGARRTI
jgi:hypothetical protein